MICETCGTRFAATTPPETCPICTDDRQYVGPNGQRLTTPECLRETHTVVLDNDAGLLALRMRPAFGIDQRALVLPSSAGNILWECLSLVTDEAVAELERRGGIAMIAISHPHFYSSMVAWSEALGGIPILLHEADRQWVQHPSPYIRFWSGDQHTIAPDVTLIRCGGHFPGSTALHWSGGPRGGTLFPGDALQVAADRRHVSFMYSYPNYIPLHAAAVRRIAEMIAPLAFDRVYGAWWDRNIASGGKTAFDASVKRYLAAISGAE
jgi:glyoxylase-like metal-dependent hydrolase (beta-lactamase superfamily II)